MNGLITKPFISYVDLKKEAMKDLEASNVDPEMVVTATQNQINHRRPRCIKSQLEDMDCANAANRRLSGYREGTPVDRTRTSLRQQMMVEYKETVGREEEVIEKIISSGAGTGGEELLQRAVQEHGRGRFLRHQNTQNQRETGHSRTDLTNRFNIGWAG
uniref:Uncharacterized protein n=1 Tax=Nelumbo nucifera TaxID=4432 RepID=A0A822YW43_NELNU|nr:TPA_asm: hypothetical protein HUJ06_006229 [Nelumbo nucifera]